MKICLIQPPIDDFYATEIRNIPLGLLSIGANITGNHSVQILDLRYNKKRTLAFPSIFQEQQDYYLSGDQSPFNLYKNYYRFGYSQSAFEQKIPKDIDLFGISANFTTYSHNLFELLKFLTTHRLSAKTVVGGHAAAATPGIFIDHGADFEVFGEGEKAFNQLIKALDNSATDFSHIPNLRWIQAGEKITNPQSFITDLDNLKFADYQLSGTPTYRLGWKKHAMLLISRGCPNHCNFCSIHQIMGHRYRSRSVSNVIAEIEEKVSQGFRSFDFEDDHFGGNKKWLHLFLDQVIEKFSAYDLSFQAMNGITATNLDEAILKKMKTAGFSSLNLALVSENEIEQNRLNRPFQTKQFTTIVYLAKQYDFFITAYVILGLPDHTIETMLNSILFLAKLPVLIGPSFFYLVPQTPIFQSCEAADKVPKDFRQYRSSYMPYETDNFCRKDLITLFRITRLLNFLKDTQKQAIAYKIKDKKIILSPTIAGPAKRKQLGLAIFEKIKETKQFFGVKKITSASYQLFPIDTQTSIVDDFLEKLENRRLTNF